MSPQPLIPSLWPPTTWELKSPPRGVMYERISFAKQIPNPVSPLFATLGLRMADIPTQELMQRLPRARIRYTYVTVNGYVFIVAGLTFSELMAYALKSTQLTGMVLRGAEGFPTRSFRFKKGGATNVPIPQPLLTPLGTKA